MQTDPRGTERVASVLVWYYFIISVLLQVLVKIVYVDLLYRVLLSTLVFECFLAKYLKKQR